MRILLTGGTGFIGSELLLKLQDRDHELYSLERLNTNHNNHIKNIKYKIKKGDIKKGDSVAQIIREVQPEVLLHLAALSSVKYSYDHPLENIETNLIGTVNLAQACRGEAKNFEKMIFASSLDVYKDTPGVLQNEDSTLLEPNSPYGVTKLAAEKYLLSLFRNYKFPSFILRLSHIYGRDRGFNPSIVEKLIAQMLEGKKVLELGSPEPVRDFLYVSDVVNACIKLLESTSVNPGQTFNISTSNPTSISELAKKVTRHTDFKNKIIWNSNSIPSRPGDPRWLVGDNTKAKKMLGWEPRVSLDRGIQETITKWK